MRKLIKTIDNTENLGERSNFWESLKKAKFITLKII